MAKFRLLSTLALLSVRGVKGQTAPQYGQCGGQGWTARPYDLPAANWACTVSNDWYSQCLPGSATTTGPTTTISTTKTSTGGSTASSTSTASSGSATLVPGMVSFVRAVEDPNFHKYLQSQVLGSASPACPWGLYPGRTISSGQWSARPERRWLATLRRRRTPANSTVVKLGMHWATTPDTLGDVCVLAGDSLEWSSPSVKRQQNNAWLVCPTGSVLNVFINLGAYDYMTPPGCADQTLNAYTGTTAVAVVT
ncbi:hypothetical protein R3P38DRAFT_3335304 [Favolaschia claudopus]|uniref:CBM1 domain-containing protein n=1 Tax=Favolaschia claudopus TaxID=2862362 RepID=A0AAV9ZA68_9AGAR